ncbi:MAG TPA: T9SS type A sorting domain-containing protein [Chitinophagales bacterium]|nr:T9SS type A sorting domain-containing protein [Chitinophagales bacterium]HNA57749.1 T9SS type A sorting domain-containing protein [Chitinophagales bacterium]HNE46633.1 T9SS type A sorting domain-containing protein [Chitinophagales bacterium]HNJ89139.1 T9SS type A sorting domain-containing protein [Chitinophagales bacterium]HNM08263.1 T9SS type A sorting domain-containing protein [Chitinophagales bacterium]
MKKLFLSLSLAVVAILGFNTSAKAQLEDGSVAPDWTLTDINGTTWNLYTLLDEGYDVFLDFSAVWCGPCWAYHTGGSLEGLYDAYGPDGTNEVMVFYIEGDGASTLDELNGIGAGTQGDWVTGTPYPIVLTHAGDPSYSAVQDYDIAYFPTIYRVCQNRIVDEVGQLSTAALYATISDCAAASVNVDPSILTYNGPVASCGDVPVSVTIQNMGFNELTACTITAYADGIEVASVDWTGSLNTYEIATVDVGTFTPADADVDLSVEITSADENTVNNVIATTVTYEDNITQIIHLELKTDSYPTETKWEVIDESTGDVVAEGGPYTNAQKNEIVFDEDIVLPSLGCFTFTCYDAYGDGITGSGYYKLYDNNGDLIQQGMENIGFEKSAALKVTTAVAIEENSAINNVSLYPNPANDNINVDINLTATADVDVTIVNMYGAVVGTATSGTLTAGAHSFTVNTADLANGMYFVQITGENVNNTVKFTVFH